MTTLLQLTHSFRGMSAALLASGDTGDPERRQVVELIDMVQQIQQAAFDVQSMHITLAEKYLAATQTIARLERQTHQPEGYFLHEPQPKVYVFAPNGSTNPPDPAKWVCCHCYAQGVSAPLERDGVVWRCPYCSFRLE